MQKNAYELLHLTESATDEQITERYNELKAKYSEDRFLVGEAGNEAARKLSELNVAYDEIMSERREKAKGESTSNFEQIEEMLKQENIETAQRLLDEFNERTAYWHYLQSVVFYKKNWFNESKKQLEIAMQMEPTNEKYRDSYNKLVEKMNFHSQTQQPGGVPPTDGQQQYQGGEFQQEGQQMGGGFCEQCATCCACNMCMNLGLNMCCRC